MRVINPDAKSIGDFQMQDTPKKYSFPPRNSIPDVCDALRLSRPAVYVRIADGRLKIFKDGRRTFVSGDELARYLLACESTT